MCMSDFTLHLQCKIRDKGGKFQSQPTRHPFQPDYTRSAGNNISHIWCRPADHRSALQRIHNYVRCVIGHTVGSVLRFSTHTICPITTKTSLGHAGQLHAIIAFAVFLQHKSSVISLYSWSIIKQNVSHQTLEIDHEISACMDARSYVQTDILTQTDIESLGSDHIILSVGPLVAFGFKTFSENWWQSFFSIKTIFVVPRPLKTMYGVENYEISQRACHGFLLLFHSLFRHETMKTDEKQQNFWPIQRRWKESSFILAKIGDFPISDQVFLR